VRMKILVHSALQIVTSGMSQRDRNRGIARMLDAEKYRTRISEGLTERLSSMKETEIAKKIANMFKAPAASENLVLRDGSSARNKLNKTWSEPKIESSDFPNKNQYGKLPQRSASTNRGVPVSRSLDSRPFVSWRHFVEQKAELLPQPETRLLVVLLESRPQKVA
jgi:hypothetical protein